MLYNKICAFRGQSAEEVLKLIGAFNQIYRKFKVPIKLRDVTFSNDFYYFSYEIKFPVGKKYILLELGLKCELVVDVDGEINLDRVINGSFRLLAGSLSFGNSYSELEIATDDSMIIYDSNFRKDGLLFRFPEAENFDDFDSNEFAQSLVGLVGDFKQGRFSLSDFVTNLLLLYFKCEDVLERNYEEERVDPVAMKNQIMNMVKGFFGGG